MYVLRPAKKCFRACSKCAESHPAHAQSLIRAFPPRLKYPMILFADSEGPNQIVRMRRLMWAFADRMCPRVRFRMASPI